MLSNVSIFIFHHFLCLWLWLQNILQSRESLLPSSWTSYCCFPLTTSVSNRVLTLPAGLNRGQLNLVVSTWGRFTSPLRGFLFFLICISSDDLLYFWDEPVGWEDLHPSPAALSSTLLLDIHRLHENSQTYLYCVLGCSLSSSSARSLPHSGLYFPLASPQSVSLSITTCICSSEMFLLHVLFLLQSSNLQTEQTTCTQSYSQVSLKIIKSPLLSN